MLAARMTFAHLSISHLIRSANSSGGGNTRSSESMSFQSDEWDRQNLVIEKHDLEVKVRNARRFLGEKHKVKITMNFRGREVTHAELGRAILDRVAKELEDVGTVETVPRMEGRHMLMLMAPKSGAGKKD